MILFAKVVDVNTLEDDRNEIAYTTMMVRYRSLGDVYLINAAIKGDRLDDIEQGDRVIIKGKYTEMVFANDRTMDVLVISKLINFTNFKRMIGETIC